jgi:hypothetical protein
MMATTERMDEASPFPSVLTFPDFWLGDEARPAVVVVELVLRVLLPLEGAATVSELVDWLSLSEVLVDDSPLLADDPPPHDASFGPRHLEISL